MTSPDRCFACNARLTRPEFVFLTDSMSNGKHYEVNVGPECFRHVEAAGADGYQPPKGGPRLFLTQDFARQALAASQASEPPQQGERDDGEVGFTREQWVHHAKRVYLACGDTEAEAAEFANAPADEQDWHGELDEPFEMALADIEGRATLQSAPAMALFNAVRQFRNEKILMRASALRQTPGFSALVGAWEDMRDALNAAPPASEAPATAPQPSVFPLHDDLCPELQGWRESTYAGRVQLLYQAHDMSRHALPNQASVDQQGEAAGLSLAQEPKYTVNGSAIVNRASGESIPADEPVFIFRARDFYAIRALQGYAHDIAHGDYDHWNAVLSRIDDFSRFKAANPERMKKPDTDAAPSPQRDDLLSKGGEGER